MLSCSISRARCSARRAVDQPASEPPSTAFSPTGIELLDTPLVQPENAIRAALLLEIGLKLIPRAEIFAALGAVDRRCGLGIGWNVQTDDAAKRAFQFVVQILGGHDRSASCKRHARASRRTSTSRSRHGLRNRKPRSAFMVAQAGRTCAAFRRSHTTWSGRLSTRPYDPGFSQKRRPVAPDRLYQPLGLSIGDAGFLLQQNDELLVVNSTVRTAFTGFSHVEDPPCNRTGKTVESFIAALLCLAAPLGRYLPSGLRDSSASSRSSVIPAM